MHAAAQFPRNLKGEMPPADTDRTVRVLTPSEGNTTMRSHNLIVVRTGRKALLAAAGIACVAALTGCHTSSKTTIGFRPNHIVQDEYAVTDSIGAAMFSRHVQLAHAEANQRRLQRDAFATAPVSEN